MAETVIQLPTGGTATVSGTPAEIAEVLRLAGITASGPKKAKRQGKRRNSRGGSATAKEATTGPMGHIRELIKDDFFKSERSLPDIQQALRTSGHIYDQTQLSTPVLRLVRQRELRRLKDKSKKWTYVAR